MARPIRVPRSAQARPAVGGPADGQGRLYVDPSLIPDGMEVQWVREEVYGQYDGGNIQHNLEQRGFEPVTRKDVPQLAPKELPGRETQGDLIRRGGLVLMMRPREVGEQERAERKASDAATLRSVNKELEKGLDGKNFQRTDDSGVSVTLDRSSTGGAFQDA
jgi:hypothetical protein